MVQNLHHGVRISWCDTTKDPTTCTATKKHMFLTLPKKLYYALQSMYVYVIEVPNLADRFQCGFAVIYKGGFFTERKFDENLFSDLEIQR